MLFFFAHHVSYGDFPRPWQFSFQKPATTMMEGIIDLHHDVFTFLLIILVFVSFIFGTIFVRYLEKTEWANARFPQLRFEQGEGITHHTSLEIVWTIIPTLILFFIATPTFALIYALDEIVEPEITIRVVGRQWYWTYEFPDTVRMPVSSQQQGHWLNQIALLQGDDIRRFHISNLDASGYDYLDSFLADDSVVAYYNEIATEGTVLEVPGFSYNSYIIPTEDLLAGAFRLLEVDRRLVLPFNVNVRVLVTSYDVLHSWAVPAFGVKVDAVPGRLNEYFLNVRYLGLFYGQCSEICGVNHGFMPIKVEVGTSTEFRRWFLTTSIIENNALKFGRAWTNLPSSSS